MNSASPHAPTAPSRTARRSRGLVLGAFLAAALVALPMTLGFTIHQDMVVTFVPGTNLTSSTNAVAASSLSVNKPVLAAEGNLMVVQVAVDGGSGVTITPPAGWTLVAGTRVDNGTDVGHGVYYKFAGAAEAGPYVWSFSPDTAAVAGFLAYTGVDETNPILAIGTGGTGNSTTRVAPAVTLADAAGARAIAFYTIDADTSHGLVAGTTIRYFASQPGTTTVPPTASAAELNVTPADGSTGDLTAGLGASAPWVAQQVVLRAHREAPPPVVDAGGDYAGAEGAGIALNGSVVSVLAPTMTWTYAVVSGVDAGATCQFSPSASVEDPMFSCTDDGTYSVTLTTDDGAHTAVADSANVVVSNAGPAAGAVSGVPASVGVNVQVSASVAFSDAGANDTHTCSIDWGDGTVAAGTVAAGACSGSHSYSTAGTRTIVSNITDNDGASGSSSVAVAVTEPEPEPEPELTPDFVTGGGWFDSPAGALAGAASETGRASFAFVAKYQPGTDQLNGAVQFQFKNGNINFHSATLDAGSLEVSGSEASFSGTGTINGKGNFSFSVTVSDGDGAGAKKPDTFRIRIWDTSGNLVYDSAPSVPADDPASAPIGGGSVVIHREG